MQVSHQAEAAAANGGEERLAQLPGLLRPVRAVLADKRLQAVDGLD